MTWDNDTHRVGTIADFDQLQSEALEKLRRARSFFALTIDQDGKTSAVECGEATLRGSMLHLVMSAADHFYLGAGE